MRFVRRLLEEQVLVASKMFGAVVVTWTQTKRKDRTVDDDVRSVTAVQDLAKFRRFMTLANQR
jgi:hypothetical protein